jgi:hypothetical protein
VSNEREAWSDLGSSGEVEQNQVMFLREFKELVFLAVIVLMVLSPVNLAPGMDWPKAQAPQTDRPQTGAKLPRQSSLHCLWKAPR